MTTTAYRIRQCIVDSQGNLVAVLPQTVAAQITDFSSTVRDLVAPVRDTAANFTTSNPVLEDGRWGIETDTGKSKVGDGTTAWNNLDYFRTGAAAPTRMTSSAFTASNPTLEDGSLGIETDTGNIKIGDGTTAWNSLAYTVDHNSAVTFEISS